MKGKRIGIFAGTFDPIHNGHLAFAEVALEHGLDKVFFLVEPRPRRKQGVRALEHRQEMAKIVAAKNPKLGVIQLEQAKFTPHGTLPLLQARFKGSELVLLFGDDVIHHMIDHLTDWPQISELADSSSLLIAARHHDIKDLHEKLALLEEYGVKFRYDFVEPGEFTASSSKIRLAIKHGEYTGGLMPEVENYITKNGIYVSSNSTK